MEESIAICGISCNECGAYIATKTDDDEKRKETAELWTKEYNADIKPEDIYCDGCVSQSQIHFKHCHVCEIRKCGLEKGVANCALCDDYACEKLQAFFKMVPMAQTKLEAIRRG